MLSVIGLQIPARSWRLRLIVVRLRFPFNYGGCHEDINHSLVSCFNRFSQHRERKRQWSLNTETNFGANKKSREEINKLGPCKAMSGTLVWTCAKSKEGESFTGSQKRMTIAQIVDLGIFYKKFKENEQIKVVYPGIK